MIARHLVYGCVLTWSLIAQAGAGVIMDQIGPNSTFQQGLSNNRTQISNFYASAPQFDISVTDDFLVSDRAAVDNVEAAIFASNSMHGFANLSALRVNIFSAPPTATGFSAGDLLSVDIPVANVAFTAPWTLDPLTRLAKMDLSNRGVLLDPGTYWLSVVAINNSFSTDIGILMSSFSGAPGNENARQVGSGLWGGGGNLSLNADAAYRISATAVPEPSTLLLGCVSLALLAFRRDGINEQASVR